MDLKFFVVDSKCPVSDEVAKDIQVQLAVVRPRFTWTLCGSPVDPLWNPCGTPVEPLWTPCRPWDGGDRIPIPVCSVCSGSAVCSTSPDR
jgi:hypothetical protein